MEVRIVTRNVDLPDAIKNHMENKLNKLTRFFGKILDAQVSVRYQRGMYIVEITVDANGVIMRGEENATDLRKAFDKAVNHIERQVKRHKKWLRDRQHLKTHDITEMEVAPIEELDLKTEENEEIDIENIEEKIVKIKRIPLKPMSKEEAVLQMELLGHDFFLFLNSETEEINVLYKRKDGTYGLIEPYRA